MSGDYKIKNEKSFKFYKFLSIVPEDNMEQFISELHRNLLRRRIFNRNIANKLQRGTNKRRNFKINFKEFLEEVKNNYILLFGKYSKYSNFHLISNLKTDDEKNKLKYELYVLIYILELFYEKIFYNNKMVHSYEIYMLKIYVAGYETMLLKNIAVIEGIAEKKRLKIEFKNNFMKREFLLNIDLGATLFYLPQFVFLDSMPKERINFRNSINLPLTLPFMEVFLLRKYIEMLIIKDILNIEYIYNPCTKEKVRMQFKEVYRILDKVVQKRINTASGKEKQKLTNLQGKLRVLKAIYDWCNPYIHRWKEPKSWVVYFMKLELQKVLFSNSTYSPARINLISDPSIINDVYCKIRECKRQIKKFYKLNNNSE